MLDFGLSKTFLNEINGSYAPGEGMSLFILGISNMFDFLAEENLITPLGFLMVETSLMCVSTLLLNKE